MMQNMRKKAIIRIPVDNVVPGYISGGTTITALSNTYTANTLIPVEPGKTYKWSRSSAGNIVLRWAYYNANKAFVTRGYSPSTGLREYTLTIPSTTYYAVLSFTKSNISSIEAAIAEFEGMTLTEV